MHRSQTPSDTKSSLDKTEPGWAGRFLTAGRLGAVIAGLFAGNRRTAGQQDAADHESEKIDEASEESFPASDPPGYLPIRTGCKKEP